MIENHCSQLSLFATGTVLLLITGIASVVSGQSAGVYLSLNGVTIPSDGYVLITTIGEEANGLYCNTDRIDCCRSIDTPDGIAQGHWYLPDGTQVGSFTLEVANDPSRNFFFRNRDVGVVRLNRGGNPPERGRFRCEVPNAADDNVIVYVNIVDSIPPPTTGPPITTLSELSTTTDQTTIATTTVVDVTQASTTTAASSTTTRGLGTTGSTPPATDTPPTLPTATSTDMPTAMPTITVFPITSSGNATAGESYSLVCTVTVTGSNDQPTITWLMGPMNNMITSGVMTTGGMSTLTLDPLAASHAGTYTCRATLDSVMDSASTTITVQNPTITVRVTSASVATPMVGSMYSIICTITGAERLTDAMVTYQWQKNGAVVSDQTMATLSFSPLTFSDAGSYTCRGTVISSLLSDPITTASSNSLSIRLTLPRPAAIRVSTNQVNPLSVSPIGSTVTLTCTADLEPAIDVPVIVNIELSDPAGSPLTATTPSVSGSTYSSMATISSFGRNDSGVYTCSAAVSPSPSNSFLSDSSSRSGTLRVTVGVMVQVNFQLIAESVNISFSLTCISTGGQASGVIWTKDGFLLRNTNPLVETDASTLSYSSVLTVSGRASGTYTCTIRGTSDQDLGSADFIVQASVPPVDVVATQSSSSAPVEVSWQLPSDAAQAITGYRIFYGNGQNLLIPSYVTRIVLNFVESSQIQSVSVRSESTQLPSELITATVTTADEQSSSETPCTCSSEVGTAVGVVILVVGTIAAVTAITVVLCWLVMRRRKSGMNDFIVSANTAYGDVKLEALGDVGGEYEDADKLTRSGRGGGGGGGGGNYETIRCPSPYKFPVSKPEAPLYATVDDTTNSGNI